MLWIILIVLIVVGICTNNFTPLKLFGKIMAWFFGIILAIGLIASITVPLMFGAIAESKKKEQEVYRESVKQTPLIQWACDSYGHQLHLGERPAHVYQCSTGEIIASCSTGSVYMPGDSYYRCQQKPHKRVNHWKFCKHKVNLSNSKYSNLLGN